MGRYSLSILVILSSYMELLTRLCRWRCISNLVCRKTYFSEVSSVEMAGSNCHWPSAGRRTAVQPSSAKKSKQAEKAEKG